MNTDVLTQLNTALAGRYETERELGSGGMATVYLASDLKHARKVALKVLKPELAAVLGAERFVVEIKTTAGLQHPHILPLFDSGSAGGFLYYVMPWIQGETLRAKLDRETQLGIDETVQITREVGDALEYAHQHGVVHRDIKPENILLHGGHAMVVDFGIALAVSAAAGGRMTETGLSLGTPHYMSPEQATAQKEISARSDIYSLGAVLYEMLTGNPPHTGASAQQIIMKIIAEPVEPVAKYRKSVPPNVAAAVMKAVEPLPADRFESAKAFGDALANPAFTSPSGKGVRAHGQAQRGRFTLAGWAVAIVMLATLAGGYALGWRTAGAPSGVSAQFNIELPDSITDVHRNSGPAQAISPDGSILVFVGMRGSRGSLYRRSLGRLAAEMIPGTEEGASPFFSPDGLWLGFTAAGQLLKMLVSGGPVTPIANTGPVLGASWGEGDIIVYSGAADRRLYQVSASGGKPTVVAQADTSTLYYAPFLLPGAKWALVGMRLATSMYDSARVGVVELSSGRVDTIRFGVRAQYANGSLVFGGGDNSLMVQPFDPSRRKTTGPATVILSNLAMHAMHGHEFSVSTNGWLEYQPATPSTNERLRVSGPDGRSVIALPGHEGEDLEDLAISPDGRHIMLRLVPPSGRYVQGGDLWMIDRQQGSLTRFTVGGGAAPVWTRDGRRIAYYVRGDSVVKAGIYLRAADQTGSPQLVLAGRYYPESWLPDGRSLAVTLTGGRQYDSGIFTLGDSAPRWIARTTSNEGQMQASPDGRRVAFTSDRVVANKMETYVQPLVGEGAPIQVSLDGGGNARWSPDSRTLYYVTATSSLVAATLAAGPAIEVTSRRVVAELGVADMNSQNVNWDIFPDGKQFLSIELGTGGAPRIALVQNWLAMARAMGAKK